MISKVCFFFLFIISSFSLFSQSISGTVSNASGHVIQGATVQLIGSKKATITNDLGEFVIREIPYGEWKLQISAAGYLAYLEKINFTENQQFTRSIVLEPATQELEEVVISGSLREVSKLSSPVPVEVYTAKFFKANPTPTFFDALQNINGVRPQLNCNICNTGDIHINGLEGPYTMILIDGMPIVSGLSTVYGLSGIPQSLIDRMEIVKGPASTLYGSEAVGGLINIITKNPVSAPLISADVFATGWGEINTDIAGKIRVGKHVQSLIGLNHFIYDRPIDNNKDGFTDVTLQHRISVFNKWNIERKNNRIFSLAARYIYEDRHGGEMNWRKIHRGGDEVYGESIYTDRKELFGQYQLPGSKPTILSFSANTHDQNSAYGDMMFIAKQSIVFGQLTRSFSLKNHELMSGLAYRYTFYDDNTPATASFDDPMKNVPEKTSLPGIFVQDEISIGENDRLLLGLRYDYHSIHGNIFTPRLNYKKSLNNGHSVLRIGMGSGYRVANIFTEDHAALTGARKVVFNNNLKPETSANVNVNFVQKIFTENAVSINMDASLFYTYFDNKILADLETDPQKIIYDNLSGHAVSKGASLNVDLKFPNGIKVMAGATVMDVFQKENEVKISQLLTEKYTAVWNMGIPIGFLNMDLDYTGNLYGPMRLPLLSEYDPRSEYSPAWSLQNVQLTKKFKSGIEWYGGIKNVLNWTPGKKVPFLISRPHDPFNKAVEFDAGGQALITNENPYGLVFDPSYVYAPNQGRRLFLGLRYSFNGK